MSQRTDWLQVINAAWTTYRRGLEKASIDEDSACVLDEKLSDGMPVKDLAEAVFMEGFKAGEIYGKGVMFRNGENRYKVN